MKFLPGIKHPNAIYPKVEKTVVRLIIKHPEWGCRKISRELDARGSKLSYVQVYRLLNRLGAENYDRRLNFIRNYSGPGRLQEDVRNEIVNKYLSGERISKLAVSYHISRDTIYRWIKKYNRGGSLKDGYLVAENHPRAIYPKLEAKVLDIVSRNPSLSVHSIAKDLPISSWTVWSILNRNNLNRVSQRMIYASQRLTDTKESVTPQSFGRIRSVFESFIPNLAPAPPPSKRKNFTFLLVSFLLLSISVAFFYWVSIIAGAPNVSASIGMVFAGVSLTLGMFFFLYSLKYYISTAIVLSYSQREGLDSSKVSAVGLKSDLSGIQLERHPFVSVHLALYNEKNVVERLAKAVTSFDYDNYEVVFADDSTDETAEKIKEFQKAFLSKGESLKETKGDGWIMSEVEVKKGVTFKHIHRTTRTGFKGGALGLALTLTDPKAEFVSVFDADFVPYPDSLTLFLKYFKLQNNGSENYSTSNTASVQGYQWHVLNKSENWITRGVRSEYAGSYVIERAGTEIYRGLKQISGSVYMIRRDVLQSIGWGTSITEDFELTLKLYERGYKVVYTPYIQAPAECVSTVRRLIRQRMRWAEGHSFNIKKTFMKLILSPKLSPAEKFETAYLAPYYLQAFFFLVGTLSWLISETVFRARLPFWTDLWGWSLVLTNVVALPLMNTVGMFLEESGERDYLGIASFVALSYILVPFQAYAAVKGFVESSEGPWFRTPKTGRITDVFKRGKFYRFISGILPGKQEVMTASPYLALTTANNRFDNFSIPRKKNKFIGKVALISILIISLLVNNFAFFAKPVKAYDSNWLYRKKLTISGTTAGAQTNFQMEIDIFSGSGSDSGKNVYCTSHCNSDFSDVRFVKSDGTTNLDYWRKSYVSGTSAVFWVEVDSIPASPSTVDIYWYYGNSGATTTSNGSNTFDFFDDFSGDLSKWTIDPANTDAVSISSGALRHDRDPTQSRNTYFDTRLRTTSYQITNGVIEYSVYLAGSSSSNPRIIHQMGWRVDSNDFLSGYVWRVQNSAADGGHLKLASGSWTAFGTALGAVTGNVWHTVKETVSGSNYTGYVDGGSAYSGTDSTKTTAGYLNSHVHGVSLDASSYVLVDDVRVRKYASPEPGYSSWGAEEQVPEMTILFIPLALAMPYLVSRLRKRKEMVTIYAK